MQRVVLSVTNDLITDQRVNKIAQYLLKSGFDVTIIGRRLKNNYRLPDKLYKTIRMRLLFNKGPLFYAEYNIRLFFLLLFFKADILVANDLDTLLANFLISVIKKKKLIYDSHEYFTEVPELNKRNFTKKIWLTIEQLILPKIKFSYTVSKSIAKIYNEKYGIDMKVIRNLPLSNKVNLSYCEKIIPENKKIIIYQGVLNIGRGIELVIEAIQFVDNVLFVIVGDGDIRNELIKLTLKLNVSDKVIFTGRVPYEELYSITCKADIGISLEQKVSLNYYYSLPNKFFDYIHANVPVLVSELPEIAEVVKKYNIGVIIHKFDPEYIATQIRNMLNDTNNQKIWKKNLIYASQDLCWEKEEVKLNDIFFSKNVK